MSYMELISGFYVFLTIQIMSSQILFLPPHSPQTEVTHNHENRSLPSLSKSYCTVGCCASTSFLWPLNMSGTSESCTSVTLVGAVVG